MVTQARDVGKTTGILRHIHSPPLLGLTALGITLLWKPVAHALTVTLHGIFTGPIQYLVATLIGLVGFTLVWQGFKRDELTATCMGYMGGAFIWIGWFEYAFDFFAEFLEVPPLMQGGYVFFTPNLLMIEASAVLYLALLIFMGANKDTRCRMFLWFHRNFRLRPNQPTPGYKRQFARIAAMETIFISWFFYVVIILTCDPRIFGPKHPVTYAVFIAMIVWGIYLLFFKLIKYRAMASAIRYAIPTAGVFWFCIELTSLWGWYTEIWIKPAEFPLSNLMLLTGFLAVGIAANMTRQRGGGEEIPA
jgi:hypothetical protein